MAVEKEEEEDKNEMRGQWEQVVDKEPNGHKLWTKGERAFNKMVRNSLQRVSDTALLWECATPSPNIHVSGVSSKQDFHFQIRQQV